MSQPPFTTIHLSDIEESHNITDFMMMLANYCAQQASLHEISRAKYKKLDYALSIPAIVLSTIGGSANIVMSSEGCTRKNLVMTSIFGLMGLLGAVLFSIHRYGNFAELQQKHCIFAGEYEKMNLDIRSSVIINSYEKARQFANVYEYLKFCKNQLSTLIDNAPFVPSNVSTNYFKTTNTNIKITDFLSVENARASIYQTSN